MDAKEYLQNISNIDRTIDRLVEEREREEAKAMRCSAVYTSGLPGQSNRVSSVEHYACKLVDLERELDRQTDEYVDLKREARALVDTLRNKRYRDILTWRYFNGLNWAQIAKDGHYSEDRAKHLHGEALLAFQKILDYYTSEKKSTRFSTLFLV